METNLNASIALCRAFELLRIRRSLIAKKKPQASRSVELDSEFVDVGNQSSAARNVEMRSSEKESSSSPCIINISSLLGVKGGMGATSYAASKAGILGFTRALVCENGRAPSKTRVNVIVPGYIDTPMTRGEYESSGFAFVNSHYLYRSLLPAVGLRLLKSILLLSNDFFSLPVPSYIQLFTFVQQQFKQTPLLAMTTVFASFKLPIPSPRLSSKAIQFLQSTFCSVYQQC